MEQTGAVYFFTGLSGAGKTTLGGLFYRRLKAQKPNVVWLDGDVIRKAFNDIAGYSTKDRIDAGYRNFRVARLLADQGIDVVLCSICMYQEVREWARAEIEHYREIYVRVTPETLMKRDQKGLYSAGKNVVGIDLPFDEPHTPDLIVQNDGGETPEAMVDQIERRLAGIAAAEAPDA